MQQLDFFYYLGLDQFESEEEFFYNLKNYQHKLYKDMNSDLYIVEYVSCGVLNKRIFSRKILLEYPNVFKYLAQCY